jgi:S-adenosylmethionine-dependent methyltransferase
MDGDTKARFETRAEAWAGYNRQPLGCLRREVTWRNLVPHLPNLVDAGNPPRVLDAGGGSGELALKLVRYGCSVWLLDYAPAMIDLARCAARGLPDDVRARLNFCLMSVDDASDVFSPHFFDAITCHTLVEYLPEPQDTLRTLIGLLRDGGLLSLSFVNRHAEVLRQVWSQGDPSGVLRSRERGTFYASLFDLAGTAYTAEEGSVWLTDLGLTITASCGVRVFADHIPQERLSDPEFFDALLRLETTMATQAPYRHIARYVHLLAHKNVEIS